MKIIPVLDLRQGRVVRGVAGRRDEYRPVPSRLVESDSPVDVAGAFRDQLGLADLYIADLDAIVDDRFEVDRYRRLAEAGFRLRVDAGLHELDRARALLDAGVSRIIAGLESLTGPPLLDLLLGVVGPQRLTLSVDLHGGALLADAQVWKTSDPLTLASKAVERGVQSLLVLDLAAVGVGGGLAHAPLLTTLRSRHPEIELVTGGGIRHRDDLEAAQDLGLDAVLVASALHEGKIARGDVARFHENGLHHP